MNCAGHEIKLIKLLPGPFYQQPEHQVIGLLHQGCAQGDADQVSSHCNGFWSSKQVSSKGHGFPPPHILPQRLMMNTEVNLDKMVEPWIKKTMGEKPFVWEKDSSPSHTSSKSQRWISTNFFDFTSPEVWPPNSPGLYQMDFNVWGAC